ncbi:hypothetical protein MTO96_030978 [Rhipicephalus appendiculatus]
MHTAPLALKLAEKREVPHVVLRVEKQLCGFVFICIFAYIRSTEEATAQPCGVGTGASFHRIPYASLSRHKIALYLRMPKVDCIHLGTPQDGNSHLVRVACLGPYLFGSTFFSKDCEIWARSSGIYYHPSKLVDSNISAEIREAILVLDTLAYHVSFVLVICNLHEYGPATTIHMAEKHRGFLTDFDKETIYSSVRSMVESSDFFRLFR